MLPHPLADLTAAEIRQASSLVRKLHANQDLVFKAITLEEPPKQQVLQYLEAHKNGGDFPEIPRIAFAAYYLKGTVGMTRPSEGERRLTEQRIISSQLMSMSQRASLNELNGWILNITATSTSKKLLL